MADLRVLPRYRPRTFVPEDLDPEDFARLVPLFDALEAQGVALRDPAALEAWLLRASELASCIDQALKVRHLASLARTDDAVVERAYLRFVEEVVAPAEPRWRALDRLYLASPQRTGLAGERWFVFERQARTAVGLFREVSVPLRTRERGLAQRYGKTIGAMTVEFDGRVQTPAMLAVCLDERDRSRREAAWRRAAERRLEERGRLDELFDELRAVRDATGRNAGFAGYRDYAFSANGCFDYGPAECAAFHEAAARVVVPALRRLQERRRGRLGVGALRPWDLAVDPEGGGPLRPFAHAAELVERTGAVFARIDAGLAAPFAVLRGGGLLDLESRPGKAPGGLHVGLEEARLPFVFANFVGVQRDVRTMLHEGGHALHYLAARDEPLQRCRHPPREFAELVAITMELLALEHLDVFYSPADAARAARDRLEGVLDQLAHFALIDAFEQWAYLHPGHAGDERTARWLALRERFDGIEDWTGLEAERASEWQRILHVYQYPLYVFAYVVATIGALQVWHRARLEGSAAVRDLRAAMALGGSRTLPELFRTAGIRLDLSAATLEPLVEEIVRACG